MPQNLKSELAPGRFIISFRNRLMDFFYSYMSMVNDLAGGWGILMTSAYYPRVLLRPGPSARTNRVRRAHFRATPLCISDRYLTTFRVKTATAEAGELAEWCELPLPVYLIRINFRADLISRTLAARNLKIFARNNFHAP